jgi:hypothetical protein
LKKRRRRRRKRKEKEGEKKLHHNFILNGGVANG